MEQIFVRNLVFSKCKFESEITISKMESSTAACPPSASQAKPSAGATGSDGLKKSNSGGTTAASKASKSGSGKAKSKSNSEPQATGETGKQNDPKGQKGKSTVPLSTFNNRLDKMEALLARVVEALPVAKPTAATGSSLPSTFRGPTGASGEEDYVQRPLIEHGNDVPPTGLMNFYGPPADAEAGAGSEDETFDADMPQPDHFVIPSIAAKFAMVSDIGDPIEEEVAQSTSYLMTHQLEVKVLEEVSAKYPVPSNCQIIDTPKVNPPIWDYLPTTTKSRDLKLQRVQRSLTRGISAFTRSVSTGDISDTQQDALALICNANFELNCLRKELIKPDLNARFTHLCKPTLPATRLLFGDDLGKQVKDLKDQQLASAGVMRGKSNHRFASHPYRGRGYNAPGRRWDSQSQAQAYSRPMSGSPSAPFLGYRQNRRGRLPPHTQTQAQRQPQTQAPGAQKGPSGQQRRK